MEVAAPWSRLPDVYGAVTGALRAVPGCIAASAHLSHSYLDGACLYFSFAAKDDRPVDVVYRELWDAGQRAALLAGANLAHHHGVGLNRSRFMAEALGNGLDVLRALKASLDRHGILNPGKLGLGQEVWP
jgi:alkyldihydroxyacetonephosphate synthase